MTFDISQRMWRFVAPTRELAQQIADHAGKLTEHSETGSHPRGLWAQEVYGGSGPSMGPWSHSPKYAPKVKVSNELIASVTLTKRCRVI